jgi:hypothetical protein
MNKISLHASVEVEGYNQDSPIKSLLSQMVLNELPPD